MPKPIKHRRLKPLNTEPGSRKSLEAGNRQDCDTGKMQQGFTAIRFLSPFVHVRRRDNLGIRQPKTSAQILLQSSKCQHMAGTHYNVFSLCIDREKLLRSFRSNLEGR